MRKILSVIIGLIIFASFYATVFAEDKISLKVDEKIEFSMSKDEEKFFFIDMKRDDFAEIFLDSENNDYPLMKVISPSGKMAFNISDYGNSLPFVAQETGVYKIVLKTFDNSDQKGNLKLTIKYSNKFKLPSEAKLMRSRKTAGYEIKVFNVLDEANYGTFLLITKSGKLKEILKSGSVVGGGYQFADDASLWDYAAGKKSSALFRATADKTGEGTPDIAVQNYTGGAHCCFQMFFFELGKDAVKSLPVISGNDSDIIAVGKQAKGSLIIQTGDSTFAYWLTSFAASPIPRVILTYKNGEFRPDAKLMKKAAPSLAVLKTKAAKAKKEISLKPYTGVESEDFLYAFWGEMLDLIYAGNEAQAWQYYDLVWDKRKAGKEKFKADFLKKLNESSFWKMMQEDKNK